jgi:hypothetical protein
MSHQRRRVPAFRIVTDVEVSASATERWRRQYARSTSEERFSGGRSKSEIEAALDACDQTPANISRILNAGWATPRCDLCEQHATVIAQVGGEYGGEPISCCRTCAERVSSLLSQFPRSADPVGEPARALAPGELP